MMLFAYGSLEELLLYMNDGSVEESIATLLPQRLRCFAFALG